MGGLCCLDPFFITNIKFKGCKLKSLVDQTKLGVAQVWPASRTLHTHELNFQIICSHTFDVFFSFKRFQEFFKFNCDVIYAEYVDNFESIEMFIQIKYDTLNKQILFHKKQSIDLFLFAHNYSENLKNCTCRLHNNYKILYMNITTQRALSSLMFQKLLQ